MRTTIYCLIVLSAGLAQAGEPATLKDALEQGKVSINARLRYEGVEQTGLEDANAITLRTRLGFTTAPLHGWKAMLEAENTTAADGDSYSQAGLNPGGAGKAVIADPEGSEINQVFLNYTRNATGLTLGRQKLVLDTARFVGDVGWRQNQQTFDAAVLTDKSLAKTTLTYGYLYQINRVFGDRHPQGDWESDSHVINATYAGWPAGTLAGYAYLLDFANAAASSCATYGASFAGSSTLMDETKLLYRAEAARQTDYGASTLNYASNYYMLEAGLGIKAGNLSLGYEVLGTDNNVGFKTPLATLHAFNGWADLFLTTPAAGLRDRYVKLSANLPEGISFLAFYHQFGPDGTGADFGDEIDAQLSRKFGKYVTATAKVADFKHDSPAFPDVRKIWVQIEFAY